MPFPPLSHFSLSIKDRKQIKDDLYEIFYYAAGAIDFVNDIVNGGVVPFQFDFTILPEKIFELEGKKDKDGSTPVLTLKSEDRILKLEDRMNADNLKECCAVHKTLAAAELKKNKDVEVLKTLKSLFEDFKKKKADLETAKENLDDYPRGRRFCCTVDRRKSQSKDKTNSLWMYETNMRVRNGDAASRIHRKRDPSLLAHDLESVRRGDEGKEHMIPEVYHLNSMEVLIPGEVHEDDIKTRKCDGMTWSFHCENVNQIKCYLWWDAAFMRFEPGDFNSLCPVWFYNEKTDKFGDFTKNQTFKDDKDIAKRIKQLQITDLHFEDFKRAWTSQK